MMLLNEIETGWREVLAKEFTLPYFIDLISFVDDELAAGKEVFPPKNQIFSALNHTPLNNVRVVIVGQDPYHGPGQAHGLSFSVQDGVRHPPSLKNIFEEIRSDIGPFNPKSGCLTPWADQGVLMLNAILTVRRGEPASHQGKGWERFTDAVLQAVAERSRPAVFVLWGKYAQDKCERLAPIMQKNGHAILKSPHPSPFSASRGFFGCRHFSETNKLLQSWGEDPIDWRILA